MPVEVMDGNAVRATRAASQRLRSERGAGAPSDVVSHLVAVQAQDIVAATLGVAVRADNLTLEAVDTARNVERSIVRLWCLRGTLHLVAAEDAHWLLELVRPRLETANRRRRADLGLDDADTRRGVGVIAQSLEAEGSLTRAQIAERLRRNGIASEGQATIHVIWRAAVDGLVCYGPDRSGEETFVALDEWVPAHKRSSPSDAVLELARRYLAACGPATDEDFGAWSGLPRRDVSRAWSALRAESATVSTPYGEMLLSGQAAAPGNSVVRLLPSFDALWLGYRDHDAFIGQSNRQRVFPGGGIIRPIVFADDRIVGVWRRRAARERIDVSVDLFEPVARDALAAAVAEYGRLAGRPAEIVQRI